jgi:capsular polysaccharide biosynthesis protein
LDLHSLVRLIVRHWLVAIVAILGTAGAGVFFVDRVAPEYEAKGSVILLAPPSARSPDGQTVAVNPFSRFDASMAVTASAMVNIMRSPEMALALQAKGVTGGYEVVPDVNGGGAIVALSVKATDQASAIHGFDVVRQAMKELLEQLQAQAGAPENTRLRLDGLSPPTTAVALIQSKMRAGVAVLLLGVLGMIVMLVLAEAWSNRRASRRAARRALQVGEPEPVAPLPAAPPRADTGLTPLPSLRSALPPPPLPLPANIADG